VELLRETTDGWSDEGTQELWWDRIHGVLTTNESASTYRALFGSWWPLRGPSLRYRGGMIKRLASPGRWVGPFDFDVCLPSDAVLIPHNLKRNQKSGAFFVASRAANRVLKVAGGTRAKTHLKNELSVREIIQEAGIGHHVPELYDVGSTRDDWHWSIMQLASNTEPLDKPLNPFRITEQYWRACLTEEILPAMKTLYENSDLQSVSKADWLHKMEKRIDTIPDAAGLDKLLSRVDSAGRLAGCDRLIEAQIHGDLFQFHVHRTADNWWLIDWGYSLRRPIIVDLMRELIFICHRKLESEARPLWAWLRGEGRMEAVPDTILKRLNLCAEWQASWIGSRIDADTIRFQLLAVILENICIHVEVDGQIPSNDWLFPSAMRGLEIE